MIFVIVMRFLWFQPMAYEIFPVLEPSLERHGACHMSQSSSMDINEISDFVNA